MLTAMRSSCKYLAFKN